MIVDIPWSATQEMWRQAEFKAGITPCLFRWHGGVSTESLRASRDEIMEKLPGECLEAIASLDLEIAYRTEGLT